MNSSPQMTDQSEILRERDRLAEIEAQFCHCGGHTICYGCEKETKELIKQGFDAAISLMLKREQVLRDIIVQGTDGKTRLVVPGDSWHERAVKALTLVKEWS